MKRGILVLSLFIFMFLISSCEPKFSYGDDICVTLFQGECLSSATTVGGTTIFGSLGDYGCSGGGNNDPPRMYQVDIQYSRGLKYCHVPLITVDFMRDCILDESDTEECIAFDLVPEVNVLNLLDLTKIIFGSEESSTSSRDGHNVTLEITNINLATGTGTLEIYMTNDLPIAGFQFGLDGSDIITITGASGGSSADAGFIVSTSSDMVLAFSLSGATIPRGDGLLVNISFTDYSDGDICFGNALVANSGGGSVGIELIDACTSAIIGCTDDTACNYNPDATGDDGSCEYEEDNFDCDGNCVEEVDQCGVCDDNPNNDCIQDCNGDFGGTAVGDNCGECDSDSNNDCIQDCNGDFGGDAVEDYCGTCDSDPSNDCAVTCNPFTDIDENVYPTVQIGTQCWMADNLRTTRYRNEDEIPTGHSGAEWAGLETGAYAINDDDLSNSYTYGNLYNWYAVDDGRGVCPEGFDLPSDYDWKILEIFIGMAEGSTGNHCIFLSDGDCYVDDTGWRGVNEGSKLKEVGNSHWAPGNTGTDDYGFTALPTSFKEYNNGDYYNPPNYYGNYWTSTASNDKAWRRALGFEFGRVGRDLRDKNYGYAVRCIQNFS